MPFSLSAAATSTAASRNSGRPEPPESHFYVAHPAEAGQKARPIWREPTGGIVVSERQPGTPPAQRKDMKKSEKKVLHFHPHPRAPAPTTILCQIGNERFAITWQIEDLPPAAPLL